MWLASPAKPWVFIALSFDRSNDSFCLSISPVMPVPISVTSYRDAIDSDIKLLPLYYNGQFYACRSALESANLCLSSLLLLAYRKDMKVHFQINYLCRFQFLHFVLFFSLIATAVQILLFFHCNLLFVYSGLF